MNTEELQAKLRELALGNAGMLPLAKLLAQLVPVGQLRELAKEHGLSPRGGFRLEKAPASKVAPLLAEPELPTVLEAACGLLATALAEGLKPDPETAEEAVDAGPDNAELRSVLRHKDQELIRARAELERARGSNAGLRQRADDLGRAQVTAQTTVVRLQKQVEELKALSASAPVVTPDRSLAVRVLSLEKTLEEQGQIELSQRLKIAEQAAQIRELEERAAELEELVPKGKRGKKRRAPPPPPERFLIPTFSQGFLKSLAGRDRRSVEHAYRAVFLFCAEGSRYPGLQVKSLEPSSVWSLRASLKLRVYFQWLSDSEVEILELLDREEQDTVLRRYRARS